MMKLTMNVPDKQIKTYLELMVKDFEHINSISRKAVLVSIRTYAVGLIRVIDFCLGRELSLNIDDQSTVELENSRSTHAQFTLNSRSIHAQSLEITDLEGFCVCGKSLDSLRKGTKFCSKKCNNLSRK